MHNDAGGQKRRTGFLTAAITGIALLAAACGNGSHTTGSPANGSVTYQQAVTFAHCLRTHGEPQWPDPTGQGNFNVSKMDIRSPRYMRSFSDCEVMRPAGIKMEESAVQRRATSKELAKFTTCMHSHGYAHYSNSGRGKRALHLNPGINPTSPSFRSAMKRCGAVAYHAGWWIQGS